MGVTLDISNEGENTVRGCLRTVCRREICHVTQNSIDHHITYLLTYSMEQSPS